MDFSERLKALRTQRGLTQEQLANALDIPETSIRRWESVGTPPKRERLEKLADFFGVSVDYLLGRVDNPTPLKHEALDDEERRIIRELQNIADEHGYKLTDPKFLQIVEAAFEFAKRMSKDQRN